MDSAYEVSAGADAIIILTEWPQFADLNWVLMVQLMQQPIVLDGRNLLSDGLVARLLEHEDVVYIPIGRQMERARKTISTSN
ncbi:UDP-glucose 6-dehydrogenase TuaD [compost metagenome]